MGLQRTLPCQSPDPAQSNLPHYPLAMPAGSYATRSAGPRVITYVKAGLFAAEVTGMRVSPSDPHFSPGSVDVVMPAA